MKYKFGQCRISKSKLAAIVWLAAQLCALFAVTVDARVADNDLVYCPLQNSWVKRELPKPQPQIDLSSICSSAELKALFAAKAKLSLGQVDRDKVFFDFASHGEAAFRDLPALPKGPPENDKVTPDTGSVPTSTSSDRYLSVSRSQQFIFGTEVVISTKSSHNFAQRRGFTESSFSRSVSPRAPPIFSF